VRDREQTHFYQGGRGAPAPTLRHRAGRMPLEALAPAYGEFRAN
jgi:hypothetical protein